MKLSLTHLLLLAFLAVTTVSVPAGAETPAGDKAPQQVNISGKVLETMNGGGYTYLLIANGKEKLWVAAPEMKATVGQQLTLVPGYTINHFTSKALHRTFDRIVFSAGPANTRVKLPEAAVKMAHEKAAANAPAPAAAPAKAQATPTAKQENNSSKVAAVKVGRVAKAKGANAYTVAELYAKKAKLDKKQVVVRGKVVKVAEHIMKHTWIHIQDGSGSKAKKNYDLTATIKGTAKEGETVTVKGILSQNVDFGSGYKYDLLIQDAQVKR
ncbi:DNA-binding protein [Geomonas sp. Red32]|uniref:DNA-binding protein n=1 Tax=Geomonas sp. Red32 TaxID=2912856 RepID=UPI00202D073A|nr:DNA-binding protein [Geomonas sp. Red32]MCM0084278.1 DNA-binding protein [Geomonas sp. Red32]